ncbi:MAG: hypothetical protein Q9221_002297 [Calogaya cf. arnoldii]
MADYLFGHPSSRNAPPPPDYFLTGTWYVNYSTATRWKDKRSVRMTYTPIPTEDGSIPNLHEFVQYQTRTSDKVERIEGINTPSEGDTNAWGWRGKGWLKIASCHWEFVDWPTYPESWKGEEWAVIWLQKTIFTPESLDILSRNKDGVGSNTLRVIRMDMEGSERYGSSLRMSPVKFFEVPRDGVPLAPPI